MHMRIYHDSHIFAEPGSEHDVRGFARDARQGEQVVHAVGDFAPEVADDLFCCGWSCRGRRIYEPRIQLPRPTTALLRPRNRPRTLVTSCLRRLTRHNSTHHEDFLGGSLSKAEDHELP